MIIFENTFFLFKSKFFYLIYLIALAYGFTVELIILCL